MKGYLKGHGLRNEGRVRSWCGWGSGPGRARCSCGEESSTLPTTASRQRWHREHKDRVVWLAARPWPGFCQSCKAPLDPPDRKDCPTCLAID